MGPTAIVPLILNYTNIVLIMLTSGDRSLIVNISLLVAIADVVVLNQIKRL